MIRRGDQLLPLSLTRATIPIPSVHGDWRNPDGSWNFVLKEYPRIGYLRLLQFGEKSAAEMADALAAIDGQVDGLILDLRNNSGVLLDAAIEICDMFVSGNGLIVSTRGRQDRLLDEHFATPETQFDPRLPMAVLVNRNSASASEIVAACLQDYGRAVVVGERSWGKGTVQNIVPVERGQSALKLTTASYWRPNGHNIDRHDPVAKQTGRWGVEPDPGLAIELTEEMIFDIRRQRNRRDLEGLDRSTSVKSDQAPPAAGDRPAVDPGQFAKPRAAPFNDPPLRKAIDYLDNKIRAIAA
jgi:carboxyl-terminal processing protease